MKLACNLALCLGLAALSLGLTSQTADARPGTAAFFAPSPAELGTQILAEIDKRALAFDDIHYDAQMDVFKGGALTKSLEFEMYLKGATQQLMNFKAPGDVAGMKVLMDAGELYVYLPDFKKVRKVATHVKSQGFLGSAFHYEDQEMILLAPLYDAEFVAQNGNETTLKLTAKADKQLNYAHLDVVIDKTKGGVTRIDYFDGSDTLVRQQFREGWTKIEGNNFPTKITMSDLKTGDLSVIQMTNIKVNQGVEDDLFSRRMLLRG